MILNGVPFLSSLSEHIHCGTENAAEHLKCSSLESKVKSVIRSYAIRGFRAVEIEVGIKLKASNDLNE